MNNSQTSPTLNGTRVLLVEDCPDQNRLYLHMLKLSGADVTLECNGHAAMSRVETAMEAFDVIVMDFKMPEMDGLQATLGIRELGFKGAIVAVTAHDSESLRRSWFLAGCDYFINKPLNRKMLVDAVEQSAKLAAQTH